MIPEVQLLVGAEVNRMHKLAQHYYNLGNTTKVANLERIRTLGNRVAKSLRKPISELSTKEKVLGGLGSVGAIAAAKGLMPELAGLPAVELGKFLPSKALMEAAQAKASAKTLDMLNQELLANKALMGEVQGILNKAPATTRKDLVEYLFNKSMVPVHERLVNASPLGVVAGDIVEKSIKPADLAALTALKKDPRLSTIATQIAKGDRGFASVKELLGRSAGIEGSNLSNIEKLQELAGARSNLESIISKGSISKNPLNNLMEALRKVPQSDRAGIPNINSLVGPGKGRATAVLQDISADTAKDVLGKLKKVPVAKALDVLEAAYKTIKTRGDLTNLDKYKTLMQSMESKFLPKDTFRLPREFSTVLDDTQTLAYNKGFYGGASQVGKNYQAFGKDLARGTAAAQQSRYGIGGPSLF